MTAASLPGPYRGVRAAPGPLRVLSLITMLLGGAAAVSGLVLGFGAAPGGAAFLLGLAGMVYPSAAAAFARRSMPGWGGMLADHPWPKDGVQEAGTFRDALSSLGTIALSAVAAGFMPGLYFDLGEDLTLALFVIGAPIGGFLGHLLGGGALVRYRRYGASRLKLPPGPVVPGASTLAELESGADLSRAKLDLRCVREVVVGAGKQAHAVRTKIGEGRLYGVQATTAGLQLVLEVPEDASANDLRAEPPVYWELFVRDEAAEYEAYFLVPVYRPTPGAP